MVRPFGIIAGSPSDPSGLLLLFNCVGVLKILFISKSREIFFEWMNFFFWVYEFIGTPCGIRLRLQGYHVNGTLDRFGIGFLALIVEL